MIEIKRSKGFVNYVDSICFMKQRVEDIAIGKSSDLLWFLEYEPLYTKGTSAKDNDLLSQKFPVHEAGRGGEFTYHGPGQRVIYLMLDMKKHKFDIRSYIDFLQQWLLDVLAGFGIIGNIKKEYIGVWVDNEKLAAIGIRVRRWVSYYGVAINLNPDMKHYNGIVPCGIKEYGVTSLQKQGVNISMETLDNLIEEKFLSRIKERNNC